LSNLLIKFVPELILKVSKHLYYQFACTDCHDAYPAIEPS